MADKEDDFNHTRPCDRTERVQVYHNIFPSVIKENKDYIKNDDSVESLVDPSRKDAGSGLKNYSTPSDSKDRSKMRTTMLKLASENECRPKNMNFPTQAPGSNLAVKAKRMSIVQGQKKKDFAALNHSNLVLYNKALPDNEQKLELDSFHGRRFSMNYRNASQISSWNDSKKRLKSKRPQKLAADSFEEKYFMFNSVLKYKKSPNSISLAEEIQNSKMKQYDTSRERKTSKPLYNNAKGTELGTDAILRNTITSNANTNLDSLKNKFKALKEIRSITNPDSNRVSKKTTNDGTRRTARNLVSPLSTPKSVKKVDRNLRIIKDSGYHAFEAIDLKESPMSQELQEERFIQRKKQIFDKLNQTNQKKNILQTLHDEYILQLGAMKCCVGDLEMNLSTLTKPEMEYEVDSQPESSPKADNSGTYINYGFSEDVSRKKRQTNVKSLEGIKIILESELQDIITDKKKEYTFEDTKKDFCDYGKIIKKLIRIVLNTKKNGAHDLKMDWKERALFAINLDHLWRAVLFSQDRIFTQNEAALEKKMESIGKFEEKYLLLEKHLDEKDRKIKQIEKDFLKQVATLNTKFENAKEDKHRMAKVAEDRYFELNCIRNDVDILSLKTYYRDLEENMLLALKEKKPQMESCQKLLNIINRIFKNKQKENEGLNLRKFRMWRKNRKRESGLGVEDEKDDDEPTAVDELLEYLYENYTELFVINGEEKDRIMIEKEAALKVLDEIPEDLIKKLLIPPAKDARTVELQTVMTMPPGDLTKSEFVNSYNHAYGDKDGKKNKGPKNNLLKNIVRYMNNNKKEKILPMPEGTALKLISELLSERLKNDIEAEKANKKTKTLPNYILDQLSMKFGLKTIAVKNLISLRELLANTSKSFKKKNPDKMPYAQLLLSIFGFESSPEVQYSQEQVNLIIKAKPLWMEAQEHCKKTIKIRKNSAFTNLSLVDLQVGGNCSLLEIIDVFTNWCNKDKELLASFIPKLTPEIPKDIAGNPHEIEQFYIDFSLVKICHKAAKLGKTIQYMHDELDEDGDGTLDADEILNGLREKFNIFFGEEEAKKLHALFEEEAESGAGEKSRLNSLWSSYSEKCYDLYRITELRFFELLIDEWDDYLKRTNEKLMKVFVEFDDNGDQVLSFEEFEQLINHLEKSMTRDQISEIFNETLEMDEKSEDLDKMNPDCFCEMALSYKLGGYGECFIPEQPDGKKK
ncbi:unnamed protein product [Moneuplotes crassus]|uniref:EF-hand domain-containing protein n=2 Tax=Euplotes crassus TaxID=5936 RepID=A0AAD1U7T1_EUPCR|nr:unnamed protein product [Moneuplotes crassus]